MNTSVLTLDSVREAQNRLADGVRVTPSVHSVPLSELAGMDIILKHEYGQATGRLVRNAVRAMPFFRSRAQRGRGE